MRRIWQSIELFNCYIHTIYTSINTHTRIHVQSAAQVSIHTRYSKRIHLYLVEANIHQRKGRGKREGQNQLLYETNQMHMLSIAMHMLITLINNPMYLKLYTNTLAYTIHTHTHTQTNVHIKYWYLYILSWVHIRLPVRFIAIYFCINFCLSPFCLFNPVPLPPTLR